MDGSDVPCEGRGVEGFGEGGGGAGGGAGAPLGACVGFAACEEEGEKQIRASLLESVQGEIEAVTGGRRMTEIMATVEEALGGLLKVRTFPLRRERSPFLTRAVVMDEQVLYAEASDDRFTNGIDDLAHKDELLRTYWFSASLGALRFNST